MTFADITTEMVARGAEDNATRNGRWANRAYRLIGNAYDWPFTEVAATGVASAGTVVVADFRKALVVGDLGSTALPPGRKLNKISFAEVAEDLEEENIALAGTSEFWWYDATSSTIKTFPLGGTIYARYHKRLTELSGVQEPVFDEEYHPLIVDRAMVEVLKDNHETQDALAQLQMFTAELKSMGQDYGVISREPSFIQASNPYDG